MQTMYLIVLTILGGLLALFAVAGWSAYTQGKLPEPATLFRWFTAGLVSAGLSTYAWVFGAGGDPNALMKNVGDALEVNNIMDGLTSAAGNVIPVANVVPESAPLEMKIGMPTF